MDEPMEERRVPGNPAAKVTHSVKFQDHLKQAELVFDFTGTAVVVSVFRGGKRAAPLHFNLTAPMANKLQRWLAMVTPQL